MRLAEALLSSGLAEESIRDGVRGIHQALLGHSRYVREPNFVSIHPDDLEFLFQAYDQRFFGGLFGEALNGSRLDFRLSRRMSSAGGATVRIHNRVTGEVSFEIKIAISILYDGFGESDRGVTACGIECGTRLEALQRIFEHELIHLGEQLAWRDSSCSRARFQHAASSWFLHSAHTHALITRRERAAEESIRVGSMVEFDFEGRRLTGRVNRITKRATVLVADPKGALYSSGERYLVYYVGVRSLRLAGAEGGTPQGPAKAAERGKQRSIGDLFAEFKAKYGMQG